MNKDYWFKYRRKFFWRKFKVTGHKFEKEQNKMVLFFTDGSLREISNWNECEIALGVDWVLASKEQIKEEAGQ